MTITLPELPFEKDALAPFISEKTIDFHYGKHHKTYVNNLVKMIENTDLETETLESIIKKTVGDSSKEGIFNNAAQVWNHTFYWHSISPSGGGIPTGNIAEKIKTDFGGFEKFVEEFKNAGLTQFGSGWAWLILKEGKLEVTKTSNADTPFAHGLKPLVTMDVWEHAYYLDYQNKRVEYIENFIKNLINWEFADSLLK
jgi:superoxide dismutase, Fe-Mn family